MTELEEVLMAYGGAWTERDPAKRMQHLEIAWAEDGRYVDPNGDVTGRAGLAEYMDAFHAQAKGSKIVVTSKPNPHHKMVHFTWAMKAPGGIALLKGHDFGTLGPDGRITQLVGFFGDPEPLERKRGLFGWLRLCSGGLSSNRLSLSIASSKATSDTCPFMAMRTACGARPSRRANSSADRI